MLYQGAPLSDVQARVLLDNEEHWITLVADGHEGRWSRYRAVLPWCQTGPSTRYCFRVYENGRPRWLGADGEHRHTPAEAAHFRATRTPVLPDWAYRQVAYQIFPDRYARSEHAPGVRHDTYYGSWPMPVQQLDWHAPSDPGLGQSSFHGGDLPGIRARLDHLQSLGVTTLYLTPVFASGSNHRYDTEDYHRVDPALGGDAALVDLSAALKARGMRLVLDAVLNHTSANHPWFNRWGIHPGIGAWQSQDSPWAGWYARNAQGEPVYWKGHSSLPVLDYAHPAVADAMITGLDSVLRRWLRPPVAIDGWRLDAIHMLGEGAGAKRNAHWLQRIRDVVKAERPDALVIGEHFWEATPWLQGDQEDAAMNYWGFTQPLWQWLAEHDLAGRPAPLDTRDFARWLDRARAALPHDIACGMWNLIDSHDTVRLFTLLGSDEAAVRCALTLQFCYPGVPCLYYGDEIGLEGGPDPDNRRCFPWDPAQWRHGVLDHVRQLAALRHSRPELQQGACQTLASGDDWIALARYNVEAATLLVLNRGAQTSVWVPLDRLPRGVDEWRSVFGHMLEGDKTGVQLRLGPMDAAVFCS
ncbi:alpha-glucosidase [Caldimonas brevitalea]|uniref:Alpha-glucosidase n=1 Tax=Caldimonas brevitalea TaxID=413882 RepID=A0A0G3BRX9_9BURK|nr:alpha-glucosidase [Caldimonas brevitalea]